MDWDNIRSMLMGMLGFATLLQFVVLEAAYTPAKAHFGVFVVVLLFEKREYKVYGQQRG